MRLVYAAAAVLLLAGCGSTASSSPKPTPTPPPSASSTQFKHAPAMTINSNASYSATMATSDGTFTIQLLPKVAPVTVNNFVFLARHHFYDGVPFHRIIQGFAIQTGDPTGTGTGGPGYSFKDEKVTMKYVLGTVAMANSGPNTNGSQFFIVVGPSAARTLKPNYTIFGKVSSGMKVVMKIAATPVGPNPGTGEMSYPLNPVTLKSVTIHQSS